MDKKPIDVTGLIGLVVICATVVVVTWMVTR